jgi:hypothetical protein
MRNDRKRKITAMSWKRLTSLVWLAPFLFQGCVNSHSKGHKVQPNRASQNGINQSGRAPALILEVEYDDFRLKFSDLLSLQNLVSRQVCTLNRIGSARPAIQVVVGLGISVGDVFQRAGIDRRFVKQVRIVKRNEIFQTDHFGGADGVPEKANFWDVIVGPGDYVVIPLTE